MFSSQNVQTNAFDVSVIRPPSLNLYDMSIPPFSTTAQRLASA